MHIVTDNRIYNSRPDEIRTEAEEKTYRYLSEKNISFSRIDHLPADTIESCHEIEKYLNADICKNLFLRNSAKTQFWLLLMCGDKTFVSKDISKKLNSTRLSFATSDEMEQYLGLTPGSASILGIINDNEKKVKIAVDKDLLDKNYFCCHPCKNTSTLKFKTEDIFDFFIPSTEHEYYIIEV